MSKINIGIWGKGVVGSATGYLFEQKARREVNVIYYDKYKNIGSSKDLVDLCDIIFLCIPTPMKLTGEICLDYIQDSVEEISKLTDSNKILIIRSTAVSGSTDKFSKKYLKFDFAFCPEFLTEKNSINDMLDATRVVIGSDSDHVYDAIKTLFHHAYKDQVTYIDLSCKEAETLKYMSNIFLAGQVMLANELYFICKKIGVDYDKIREQLKYDTRIGTHNKVPGPDGDYGVGGKCLKKDPEAFIHLAESVGFEPIILKSMMSYNDKIRINKDWLDIAGATETNTKFN